MARSLGSLTECAAMRPRSPFIPLDRLGARPPQPRGPPPPRYAPACVIDVSSPTTSWLNTFIAVLWKFAQQFVIKESSYIKDS